MGDDDRRGDGVGRRIEDDASALVLHSLEEASRSRARIEAALEVVTRSMVRLESTVEGLAGRVNALELWRAGEEGKQRGLEATKDDKGAGIVKIAILALTCLAVLLYLFAQHI